MRFAGTAAQVRALDAEVIHTVGVPGVCLMETASRAVAEAVRTHHRDAAGRGVVVVCGPGNNGGDGYGCARWLASWGIPVRVWSLSGHSKGDAAVMREACRSLGVPSCSGLGEAGLVVDAVFGTGITRNVEGAYADVLRAMNEAGCPIVAVDIPSGLHTDTGAALGVAVRATRTVTFGWTKLGLLAEPGADLAGEVEVADIGLGAARGVLPAAELPDAADLAPLWPRRGDADHKTRSGHLLMIAGSRNLAGAAVLACRGALAAGAGLVTLVAPRGATPRLAALPPEVMLFESGPDGRLAPPPDAALERRTAVVAGPGLGNGVADLGRDLSTWLTTLWQDLPIPVLFDADALPCARGTAPAPRVVTPHPGEAGRLLGRAPTEVQADRFGAVTDLAHDGRVAVLKGRNTLIGHAGSPVSVNPTGNPALATGGSGDVLSGIIGALLARGVDARDAARLGVWVHGRAADLLVGIRPTGWTAGDVADAVPEAIAELMDA